MTDWTDIERWLDKKLELAYEQGFRDGVDRAGKEVNSLVSQFREEYRAEMQAEMKAIRADIDTANAALARARALDKVDEPEPDPPKRLN